MATAPATRPSGPVLSIPNYGSATPNRIKLAAIGSPAKSVSVSSPPASAAAVKSRPSCMCSPTNHPGSFRCSLHKEPKQEAPAGHGYSKPTSLPSPPPPAVAASTGSGAGGRMLARRAIAPPPQSPHQRRAAGGFRPRPRPSRLSTVSFASEGAGDNRQ